jgi:glycosyltransferase involved in cell wall biosynthesis
MKICLIAPIPPFRGGISKYCYSLAQELEKRHELLLLSYRRQYPAMLYGNKDQIDSTYDKTHLCGEFRRLTYDIDSVSIASWIETAKTIGEFSPDMVIFPWWVVYWAPMYAYLMHYLKKRGIKCLLICINVFEHEDSVLKKELSKYVIRQADQLIVHSEQELVELRAINQHAAIRKHLLPLFCYDNPLQSRTDSSLHLLFFGFVRPYKGLDMLLRAIALLKDRDVVLKVTGEIWDGKDDYFRLVEELGIAHRVEIIDRYVSDDEMSGYFSWADLVVLPYRTAKTSGVIATAYGYGKPVLATDVGGFHEVVQDEYTGKLVRACDPQAIADGIAWFDDNRQVGFEKNIASFVAKEMSWGSLVNTIEEMAARDGG